MNYPALINLMNILSVDVGLSEEEEASVIDEYMQIKPLREQLKTELLAFESNRESWIKLLDNDGYCVTPIDSEEEAKQYLMDKFGTRLFTAKDLVQRDLTSR